MSCSVTLFLPNWLSLPLAACLGAGNDVGLCSTCRCGWQSLQPQNWHARQCLQPAASTVIPVGAAAALTWAGRRQLHLRLPAGECSICPIERSAGMGQGGGGGGCIQWCGTPKFCMHISLPLSPPSFCCSLRAGLPLAATCVQTLSLSGQDLGSRLYPPTREPAGPLLGGFGHGRHKVSVGKAPRFQELSCQFCHSCVWCPGPHPPAASTSALFSALFFHFCLCCYTPLACGAWAIPSDPWGLWGAGAAASRPAVLSVAPGRGGHTDGPPSSAQGHNMELLLFQMPAPAPSSPAFERSSLGSPLPPFYSGSPSSYFTSGLQAGLKQSHLNKVRHLLRHLGLSTDWTGAGAKCGF